MHAGARALKTRASCPRPPFRSNFVLLLRGERGRLAHRDNQRAKDARCAFLPIAHVDDIQQQLQGHVREGSDCTAGACARRRMLRDGTRRGMRARTMTAAHASWIGLARWLWVAIPRYTSWP